jgi:ABC-type sugar transport system permease subunit
MPTIYFVVITSTILSMRLFEPILLLTGGGPLNSTTTVSFQIYEQAFQFARWGRASAQATIFFFIVLVITVVQYKVLPESYEK